MRRDEIKLEKEPTEEQLINTYNARYAYFCLLEGTLRSWLWDQEDEERYVKKLMRAIQDYEDYLIDQAEKLEKKLKENKS